MEEKEYCYWEVNYISCESNERWGIAKTPKDWDNYDVMSRIHRGGCGDDIAEIIDVVETTPDDNCHWDFCD
jgi:hypothetical protein